MVTVLPAGPLITQSNMIMVQYILMYLAFLVLALILAHYMSRSITNRISSVIHQMSKVRKGSLSPMESPVYHDEIGDLIDTYNYMTRKMDQLMADQAKAAEELRIAEFHSLQAQINPHFLYNILGTIRTCQALGKLDIADQMLTNLTAFYRLTLRKSKELIPIKDELEIARLYLEMEKLCHKDNLNWEINAEDGIENFMICKFTLQPFLENSILHGLSADTPEVFISIQVLYGDDTVVISIEDNGAGMSPETLEQLRYAIDNKVINYEKHFGISNVSARISNPLYGNGSVRIDSHPGNGTYVTIEFQQMEDTDEENNDCR